MDGPLLGSVTVPQILDFAQFTRGPPTENKKEVREAIEVGESGTVLA